MPNLALTPREFERLEASLVNAEKLLVLSEQRLERHRALIAAKERAGQDAASSRNLLKTLLDAHRHIKESVERMRSLAQTVYHGDLLTRTSISAITESREVLARTGPAPVHGKRDT